MCIHAFVCMYVSVCVYDACMWCFWVFFSLAHQQKNRRGKTVQIHLFAEHALDTLLHRDCRRRACPASTLELQCHLATVGIDRHNATVAPIRYEVWSNLVEHDIDGIDGKGKLSLLTPCPSSSSLASLKGANHSSILLDRGRGMMMRKRRRRRRGSALLAEHVKLCDIVLAISAHMAGIDG